MLRKLILVGCIASSVLALAAQGGVAVGSHGRGAATNEAGKKAEFNYEVAKVTRATGVRKNGRFQFNGPRAEGDGRVAIRLRELGDVVAAGNVSEFGGPALMTLRRNNRIEEIRGRVLVRVQDRRNRENPNGDRDTIAVRFRREDQVIYEFVGVVQPGDLTVFTRTVR